MGSHLSNCVHHKDLAEGYRISYYGKRPFVTDPRLAVLPRSLFVGKRVLDIGCNEGWVTCEIGVL